MSIGMRPTRGFRQIDGLWLRGLSDGDNRTAQNNVVALAGGGQAGATLLSATIAFISVLTVATAGDSVMLPYATNGNSLKLYNSTANLMNVFANNVLNKLTGALDTIGRTTNPTAFAVAAGAAVEFFSPQDGVWVPIKSA